MKKRSIAIGFAILMIGVATCFVGTYHHDHVSNESTSDITQTQNGASVRPELRKALNTIYKKYPDISIGEEYKIKGSLSHCATMGPDGYTVSVCSPENYQTDKNILRNILGLMPVAKIIIRKA